MKCATTLVLLLLVLAWPAAAPASTVKELVRIKGQSQTVLRGVGLVVGLSGTGDSGKELAVARPLAAVLENSGNSLGSPLDLKNSKSVALVMVTCTIPEGGARADDRFDVSVSVINSATSLKGGELFLAPMRGPYATSEVYALASGLVDLQDASVPTQARVRGGARLTRDILGPQVGDTFDLLIDPPFSGWASASQMAIAINSKAQPQGPIVATAIDDRTIRVVVPPAERADRAGFVADVLSADINTSLLDLPAQVICNQRTGSIIITGDVEISPVAITQKDLNITTTVPPPVASAQNPLIQRDRWAEMKTTARPSEMAKLSDLVKAFKQLDIPVSEQIGIIQMLHKTGKLQAKVIID
jgi:flagellar P-ring protein precursor FlgI